MALAITRFLRSSSKTSIGFSFSFSFSFLKPSPKCVFWKNLEASSMGKKESKWSSCFGSNNLQSYRSQVRGDLQRVLSISLIFLIKSFSTNSNLRLSSSTLLAWACKAAAIGEINSLQISQTGLQPTLTNLRVQLKSNMVILLRKVKLIASFISVKTQVAYGSEEESRLSKRSRRSRPYLSYNDRAQRCLSSRRALREKRPTQRDFKSVSSTLQWEIPRRTHSSDSANFMRKGRSRSATHHSCPFSAATCCSVKTASRFCMDNTDKVNERALINSYRNNQYRQKQIYSRFHHTLKQDPQGNNKKSQITIIFLFILDSDSQQTLSFRENIEVKTIIELRIATISLSPDVLHYQGSQSQSSQRSNTAPLKHSHHKPLPSMSITHLPSMFYTLRTQFLPSRFVQLENEIIEVIKGIDSINYLEFVEQCQSGNIENVDLDQQIMTEEADCFWTVIKLVKDMKVYISIVHHQESESCLFVCFQLADQCCFFLSHSLSSSQFIGLQLSKHLKGQILQFFYLCSHPNLHNHQFSLFYILFFASQSATVEMLETRSISHPSLSIKTVQSSRKLHHRKRFLGDKSDGGKLTQRFAFQSEQTQVIIYGQERLWKVI